MVKNIQIRSGQRHPPSHYNFDSASPILVNHRRIQYEGQPLTFYGHGEIGHMSQVRPKKQGRKKKTSKDQPSIYATITAHRTPTWPERQENMTDRALHTEQVSHTEKMFKDVEVPENQNGQSPFVTASDPYGEIGKNKRPEAKAQTQQPQSSTLEQLDPRPPHW